MYVSIPSGNAALQYNGNMAKQEGSQAGRGDLVGQQWTAWVSEWIQPQKWASGVLVTTVGACPKKYQDVPTMWSACKGSCYWVQYCVWRPQPNMWLVFCNSAIAQLELILSLYLLMAGPYWLLDQLLTHAQTYHPVHSWPFPSRMPTAASGDHWELPGKMSSWTFQCLGCA